MKPHKYKRFMSYIQNLKVGDLLTGTYHGKKTVAYCYKSDLSAKGPRFYFKWIVGKSPCGRQDEFVYQNEMPSLLNCGLKIQHRVNVDNGTNNNETKSRSN